MNDTEHNGQPEAVDATRESPDDHPNDHIDVAIEHANGGRSILRFDVAGQVDRTPGEVARYRYEVVYDGAVIDTDQELIETAAAYIREEMGVDTETKDGFACARDDR